MSGARIDRATVELDADVEVEASRAEFFAWAYFGDDQALALYASPDAWPAIYRRLGEALIAAGVQLDRAEVVDHVAASAAAPDTDLAEAARVAYEAVEELGAFYPYEDRLRALIEELAAQGVTVHSPAAES